MGVGGKFLPIRQLRADQGQLYYDALALMGKCAEVCKRLSGLHHRDAQSSP